MLPSEFQTLLKHATGQLRLHLLLMANCGYRSGDISDLKANEVDWLKGRIIRKRSKLKNQINPPVVEYKLWAESWELLQQYGNRKGTETVLRTESGGLWCWEDLGENGKLKSSDNIATNYKRLAKKLGIEKSSALIRKAGDTFIKTHPTLKMYSIHYLGDSAKGTEYKHYSAPDTTDFDTLIDWLRLKFLTS